MLEQEIVGRLHSVETFGAVDGPGIRYVLFLQGCPLKCLYCHNPDSWDAAAGQLVTSKAVVEEILLYRNYIRSGGLTISGGEPMLQRAFVSDVIDRCHREGIHVAVDTAGSLPLEYCRPVLDRADMLLLDIKAMDPEVCKELTGQDNKNTIAMLDDCETNGKPVWIRHVLVPGYTLPEERLASLADFLKGYTCVKKIELLPFHKMGEYKWEELGRTYTLYDTPAPTEEEISRALAIFKERGLPVSAG